MLAPGKLARAVIGFTLLGALLPSCERKAPGPEECARFAEAVLGTGRYINPVIDAQIERQTQECLTRPYDRELLRCVLLTRQARVCLVSFRARHGDRNDDTFDQELPE
ncbi:MAG TPA: hypothetical protein VER04_10615 [Polyangiaceae bacterium]|jgi:hypothetical protein|nr:hypothetical protein [Polyangiaceae bacterium]